MTSPRGGSPTASNRRPRLVLASASPRRAELLGRVGVVPDAVAEPGIDEAVRAGELPRAHAVRLAREKAEAVLARLGACEPTLVLAGDTVVACGRRILPKAESEDAARACLSLLSGRRHLVLTAIAVLASDGRAAERLVETRVGFKRLSGEEIAWYLASGEWRGKAGGYAVQGRAAIFVDFLSGSHSAVVGLPLHETAGLLAGLGYPVARAP
ncbi:MAG: septum formation protein Maf [Alphaproteobacteria bacterium]|nr:septum formation protein Maf [Alphaproteobacteria bacterium]